MTSCVTLVGELNPYGADPYFALYPEPARSAGGRLCEIVGLSRKAYVDLARVNLCAGRWSMPAARDAARALRRAAREAGAPRAFVLLGSRVAAAWSTQQPPFGVLVFPDVVAFATGERAVVRLPHPSGLCRAWNVPGARERALAALREAAPDVPWGSWPPLPGGSDR